MEEANMLEGLEADIFLIEFFGGVGSQLKALKRLEEEGRVKIKGHILVEVDVDATIVYAAIHCGLNEKIKSFEFPTREDMILGLEKFNWWRNDKPTNIKRLSEKKLKQLFLAQKLTNNLGDIFLLDVEKIAEEIRKQKAEGAEVLLTWSSPCQDFSIAGKQKGFSGFKGSLTGKSIEVFKQLKELGAMVDILLFENVPNITSKKFVGGFNEMCEDIESLGYENIKMILNAKEVGLPNPVPQSRKRIFILSLSKEKYKNISFTEPNKTELPFRLKAFLEKEVDKKYYLDERTINNYLGWNSQKQPLENIKGRDSICPTITANSQGRNHAQTILYSENVEDKLNYKKHLEEQIGMYDFSSSENFCHGKRVKESIEIFPTVITKPRKAIIQYNQEVIPQNKTICLNNKVNGKQPSLQERIYSDKGISTAITTCFHPNILIGVKIRKLSPKECWRLMGFQAIDYENAAATEVSETQIYKQAGNSIVVNVLHAIFDRLF